MAQAKHDTNSTFRSKQSGLGGANISQQGWAGVMGEKECGVLTGLKSPASPPGLCSSTCHRRAALCSRLGGSPAGLCTRGRTPARTSGSGACRGNGGDVQKSSVGMIIPKKFAGGRGGTCRRLKLVGTIAKKNTQVVRRSMSGAVKAQCFIENTTQCSSFVTMEAFLNRLCQKKSCEPVLGFSIDRLRFC